MISSRKPQTTLRDLARRQRFGTLLGNNRSPRRVICLYLLTYNRYVSVKSTLDSRYMCSDEQKDKIRRSIQLYTGPNGGSAEHCLANAHSLFPAHSCLLIPLVRAQPKHLFLRYIRGLIMRHTEDSDTLTRILFERFTLSQEDVAKVWNHVVKLTWEQSSEDRAPHMLYNRHVKGYGGSVKARATYAAVYDRNSPSKDVLEKREVNRARIAGDAEGAMTNLGIAIKARHASYEGDATDAGTKRKAVEGQGIPTAPQRHNTNVQDAEEANTFKRHRFDRENFYEDITAAYKDRKLHYTIYSNSHRHGSSST
ncbi:hypothetical protein KC318_g54 [Hortaea werneckii]|nr:hypothetical protein KC334_g51 [Hortaea werneckii]KAI7028394.1 hypothetical protein KC355_g53 [Hortaea werneckii]KAI7676827.1 hypothetical protein KC318_g54 [Hortaea werneckii]